MRKKLKQAISLLLVIFLLGTLLPVAYAAETPEAAEEPEETTASPPGEPGGEVDDSPDADEADEMALSLLESGISTMSIDSTQNGILLFDYTDNGNYTTVLARQIAVEYRLNGTGSAKTAYLKNLGWHFARYNNTPYPDQPVYCIEPYRSFAASTSGNSVDRGVTLTGSGTTTGSNTWYALPQARREAIGLVLLYSNALWNTGYSVTTTKRDDNPNVPLRVATQILIYETVCGMRQDGTFARNEQNECGTDGAIFYNVGCDTLDDFAYYYNQLAANVQAALKFPSFTSASSADAPTIHLNGKSTTVTDHNGVLANWSFSDGNGVSFSKAGNDLTITQTGTLSSPILFAAKQSLPSAANSTYNLWYMTGSSYQTTISLAHPSTGTASAYFIVDPPALGSLSLTKTTEDGKNLGGWQFGIYSNAACSALVSGPHTTDSSGRLSVGGLSAGTYYVKELGNTNAALSARYTCASTNPQAVTIASGGTASVSFQNRLKTGSVQIVKTTNTGKNLEGWRIGLYTDAACTAPVSGSPFTTTADGTVTVNGLTPGTYYAKEAAISDPYWVCDPAVKSVQVTVGTTASVSFANTQYGRIAFRKTTNTGKSLGGWTFRVTDGSGKTVGEYTTDESGNACTENLPLGRYTVVELPTGDTYWSGELGPHVIFVRGGETAVDRWYNRDQGLARARKQTNTGDCVSGWEISIFEDEACTRLLHTLTTDANGTAGIYLDPGVYWARETGDAVGRFASEYWMVDSSIQKIEVKPHETAEVTFSNTQYGKLHIRKSMEDGSSPKGWQFRISDSSGAALDGSPFTTDASGEILCDRLLPGTYTVEELLPENSPYICATENPVSVSVKAGETAQVNFANALKPGKIIVQKVDATGAPLSGAVFLLEWSTDGSQWQPVVYSQTPRPGSCAAAAVKDGCLTSGADGLLVWDGLRIGLHYRVTEVSAPNGYNRLPEKAFEGILDADHLQTTLTVVNTRTFTLPETGSASRRTVSLLAVLSLLVGVTACCVGKRKRKIKKSANYMK